MAKLAAPEFSPQVEKKSDPISKYLSKSKLFVRMFYILSSQQKQSPNNFGFVFDRVFDHAA